MTSEHLKHVKKNKVYRDKDIRIRILSKNYGCKDKIVRYRVSKKIEKVNCGVEHLIEIDEKKGPEIDNPIESLLKDSCDFEVYGEEEYTKEIEKLILKYIRYEEKDGIYIFQGFQYFKNRMLEYTINKKIHVNLYEYSRNNIKLYILLLLKFTPKLNNANQLNKLCKYITSIFDKYLYAYDQLEYDFIYQQIINHKN